MPSWKDTPTPTEGVLMTLQVDAATLRRLEDICRRAGMKVPNAVRMLLIGAVQRGDFDWSPWDSSITDNGYMPYELFKKRAEALERVAQAEQAAQAQRKAYQAAYYARRKEAKRAASWAGVDHANLKRTER